MPDSINLLFREGKLTILSMLTQMPHLDLTRRNSDLATALHYIVSIIPNNSAEEQQLKEILTMFTRFDIDPITNNGETPLHRAVFKRNFIVTKFLLENGAQPNIQNSNGITPLYYALDERDHVADLNIIRILLVYGADSSIKSKYGTPLDCALAAFNSESLQLLQDAKTGKIRRKTILQTDNFPQITNIPPSAPFIAVSPQKLHSRGKFLHHPAQRNSFDKVCLILFLKVVYLRTNIL